MNHLRIYSTETLKQFTNSRKGELKFGKAVATTEPEIDLKNTPYKYVLIGIPEDVGVRANHGVAGTNKAWESCLSVLCNMQQNQYTQAHHLLILGEVDCRLEMEEASTLDVEASDYFEKLGVLVSRIDVKVSEVVETVISAGKFPIIIGGGHNNSFGNLKGLSQAKTQKVNALNFDAHSDFRALEHRHSGNGFSYAKEEGYLENYFIYGLHKQYVSQVQLDNMAQNNVDFSWFNDINISEEKQQQIHKTIEKFICNAPFGLEIDLDAIANMGSSALTPVGFSVTECLNFIKKYASHKSCGYIHLCEGSPDRGLHANQVGKLLAYAVSNIIAKL